MRRSLSFALVVLLVALLAPSARAAGLETFTIQRDGKLVRVVGIRVPLRLPHGLGEVGKLPHRLPPGVRIGVPVRLPHGLGDVGRLPKRLPHGLGPTGDLPLQLPNGLGGVGQIPVQLGGLPR